jgi:four helix bundle protein
MRDFRSLSVWLKAHALALEVYRLTKEFPKDEIYGLTSQMRRSAVSVPANIAEGCGRDGEPEFRHFMRMAFGSATELEYYVLLSHELALLSGPDCDALSAGVVETKRMLAALIRSLKSDS